MAREEKLEESHSRKHRRLSDDEETEKSSKRHRHRRHKHRHRRHRSRKHADVGELGGEDVAPPIYVGESNRADDDVEEGEILEEDGWGEAARKKLMSEDESGEIKFGEFQDNNRPVDEHIERSLETASDCRNGEEAANMANKSSDYKDNAPQQSNEDDKVNGNVASEYKREDKKRRQKSASPSRQSEKRHYHDTDKMEVDRNFSGNTRSSFSSDSDDKYRGRAFSPLSGKIHDHVYERSRSRSHDCDRGRSRSRSIIEEEDVSRRRRRLEHEASRDRRHNYGRHMEDGRHASREVYDRERSRDRELDREHRRDLEREGSKAGTDWMSERRREVELDRERRRERELRSTRDRDRDRDRRHEKERDRSRDRDRDRKRESEKDRDGNSYGARYSGRERERDRRNDNKDKGPGIENERKKHKDDRNSRYGEPENDQEGLGEREDDEQEDSGEGLVWKPAEQEEEELNRIKEESRKRRQAILEKYKNQQSQPQNISASEDKGKDNELTGTAAQTFDRVVSPERAAKANVTAENDAVAKAGPGMEAGVNDHVENVTVDGFVAESSLAVEKSPSQNGIFGSEKASVAAGLGEGTPKSERSTDIPCDDIFGDSPAGVRRAGKGDGVPTLRSGLHDNWDDAEGYYSYQFGELLNDRYEVIAAHGKGVFSTVVRAKDVKAVPNEPQEVAIKIIRNNDTMHKSGQTEVQILKKLAGADPDDRRHCVRFLSSFKYRNHLCLVFESLNMNLRELLKKFGRNIGLKLTAVRAYAKQLFVALKHLKNCGVLHCDIKPDNMLVNEAKNVLKLCDFGNAMFAGKNEITPYLVSRFYRAPEIILGLSYDHPLDMWSVGCCLYELYCGKVLFPGRTNNDMLRLQMELKGPFPKKMLRKGAFTNQYFDQDLCFHAMEEDPVTGKMVKRMIVNVKPKDIGSVVKGYPGEDPKMLANFKDLLDKIFTLDPERRLTVSHALAHPFIIGK